MHSESQLHSSPQHLTCTYPRLAPPYALHAARSRCLRLTQPCKVQNRGDDPDPAGDVEDHRHRHAALMYDPAVGLTEGPRT
jgi:hypothetical protein